jgi:hypothetical protein
MLYKKYPDGASIRGFGCRPAWYAVLIYRFSGPKGINPRFRFGYRSTETQRELRLTTRRRIVSVTLFKRAVKRYEPGGEYWDGGGS